MLDVLIEIVAQSWLVMAQMSHWLLFGFVFAGLLSLFVSPRWLERHLGGDGMGPIVKASLFGVPLPLCSCGVIPVAASLRQHGASRGATAAFLLSTPQTGVDSIFVTYSMLGPLFALYRPVAAMLSGLVGGVLVQALGADTPRALDGGDAPRSANGEQASFVVRSRQALFYGLVQLPRDIGIALLIGVVIAGAMSALIPAQYLAVAFGSGVLSVLLLMAAGVPVYVCATASVPIAAGLIHMGASPGAALAFLVAGPATNAAALTTIWKVLGKRTALVYLGCVALAAFVSGLLLNWIAPWVTTMLPELSAHAHSHDHVGLWQHLVAALLLAVIIAARWLPFSAASRGDNEMTPSKGAKKLEFKVTGMNCSHCQNSVQRALGEMPGVDSVEVDLKQGSATVIGDGFEVEPMIAKVSDLGFQAEVAKG